MRKIAFIVSSLDTGGAQRAVSNIVTNWPDDWEIDIILNNAAIIKYPYKGNIIDLKIKEPSLIFTFVILTQELLEDFTDLIFQGKLSA